MRVDFSSGDSLEDDTCLALSRSEIRKLFRFLESHLKKEAEWGIALERLGVESVGSVQVHVCDDLDMRAIQKQYRKLDRTTDVLSFPSIEIPGISTQYSCVPRAERSWGQLVLSHEAVERGAKRARRKLSEEYLEVLIHGFLHLLGFDHVIGAGVSRQHAKRMKALQAQLLTGYLKGLS